MEKCHAGATYVFSLGTTSIYGGGLLSGVSLSFTEMDILIPLLEDTRLLSSAQFENGAEKDFPYFSSMMPKQKILRLPIKDYGIPNLTREQWLALVHDLSTLQNKKVVVFCKGGHGRTGLVLSILYGLSRKVTPPRPIGAIRYRYCSHAVETNAQVEYIIKIITGD